MGKSVTQSGRKAAEPSASAVGVPGACTTASVTAKAPCRSAYLRASSTRKLPAALNTGNLALGKTACQFRVAGLDVRGRISGNNDQQIVRPAVRQLAELRDRLGEGFFEALQVVEKLRALLRLEKRAVVVAFLAREVANFGNAHEEPRAARDRPASVCSCSAVNRAAECR